MIQDKNQGAQRAYKQATTGLSSPSCGNTPFAEVCHG